MKKVFRIFVVFLLSLLFAVFALKIVFYSCEIIFRVNYIIFSPIVLLFSVFLLIIGKFLKEKVNSVCVSFLILFSFLNLILCLFASGFSIWTFFVFISMIICIVLGIYQGKDLITKVISIFLGMVVCVVVLTPLGATLAFASLMADIGEITVVNTISSDDGRYIAEVKSSDQGALGGSTFVDVKDRSFHIDLVVFEIEKKPTRVYSGAYESWKKIEIGWKDDNVLLVNGREYFFD